VPATWHPQRGVALHPERQAERPKRFFVRAEEQTRILDAQVVTCDGIDPMVGSWLPFRSEGQDVTERDPRPRIAQHRCCLRWNRVVGAQDGTAVGRRAHAGSACSGRAQACTRWPASLHDGSCVADASCGTDASMRRSSAPASTAATASITPASCCSCSSDGYSSPSCLGIPLYSLYVIGNHSWVEQAQDICRRFCYTFVVHAILTVTRESCRTSNRMRGKISQSCSVSAGPGAPRAVTPSSGSLSLVLLATKAFAGGFRTSCPLLERRRALRLDEFCDASVAAASPAPPAACLVLVATGRGSPCGAVLRRALRCRGGCCCGCPAGSSSPPSPAPLLRADRGIFPRNGRGKIGGKIKAPRRAVGAFGTSSNRQVHHPRNYCVIGQYESESQ